ncbi:MAG: DUF4019 domain-containing protein [Nitrosomonas sp.]|nr:DUF4019 domain-containing protein [Nitrosomonas sp.]
MKKQFVALVVLFFCSSVTFADDSATLEAVERSARAWLALTDTGRYQESWSSASAQFKAQHSEANWTKKIQSIRLPQGALEGRYLAAAGYAKTPSGFSDGDYIMLQFYVTFSKSGLSREDVTLEKQSDETWLIAEYVIK